MQGSGKIRATVGEQTEPSERRAWKKRDTLLGGLGAQLAEGTLSGLTPQFQPTPGISMYSMEAGRGGAWKHCLPGMRLPQLAKLGWFVTESLLRALELSRQDPQS